MHADDGALALTGKGKLDLVAVAPRISWRGAGKDKLLCSVLGDVPDADKRIHDMMTERIDTLQQTLAHYEKIKRFTLLPHGFTMENGELTSTLKLKRAVVYKNYKETIDKMYEE